MAIHSQDGTVECRADADISCWRGNLLLWRTENYLPAHQGPPLKVSQAGWVIGDNWAYDENGGRIFGAFSEVRCAWFSADGHAVYQLGVDLKAIRYSMGPERQRNLSTEELRIELDNPQAPADDILVALGPSFPHKALTRVSPILHLGALGQQQKLLAIRPKDPEECSLLLEACWLCGPATFKTGLRQALEMEWSGSTPWSNAMRSAGPLARPWLLEWLRGCQEPILAFNILRIIPTPAPELPEDFERLARSNYPGLRRLSISALDQLGESARLSALLDTPGVLTSELEYFRSVTWPDVVPALILLLKDPRLAEPALECLKFQTKSDLGLDYEAWNNWQQGSPDRRLAFSLAASNQTALLLQSQMGQLRPESLKEQQRLIRIFDPHGKLDRNGRYYCNPRSYCSLTEDSPHPIQTRQSVCPASERSVTWTENGEVCVRDLRTGGS